MADSLLGGKIGQYRVVDKIATGGMGEIYAGFDDTLQRKVAIKGIRPDYQLDEDAKARFLREARVLSQLGHPHICQIYGYVTEGGSDYIVMEMVEGKSLKKAMKKGLDERAKMRVADQVAGVLVVAHEKGVIHRDLKPDNIMLMEDGEIKVLDFGLSRQLSDEVSAPRYEETLPGTGAGPYIPPVSEETVGIPKRSGSSGGSGLKSGVTMAGEIVGTLGYMSPEQARGEVALAASDMYSFGLLLQELFTGKPPFDPEMEPTRRLERTRRGETLPAEGLDPDLAALINRLKSLAPGARPSAADTVARLQWIREKPLRRRKKALLTAASAALVLFSIAMTVQSIRATRAEKRALEEAETARQVSAFLVSLFKVSDPGEARGRSITAREILERGAKKIETDLKGQPLVQARLMSTMGNVYTGLGLFKDAEPLIGTALSTREKHFPKGGEELAESLSSMGILYLKTGRYREAEPLVKRSLAMREKELGPDDPEVAATLNVMATLYLNQGKYGEAEPIYKRALGIQERSLGAYHQDLAATVNNLALLYWYQGRYAESEPLFRRCLEIWERALGPDHPNVATALNSVAAILWQQGKNAEAEPFVRRALSIQEKVLGPDHPALAVSLTNLAAGCANQGKFSEAERYYGRALSISRKALGPEHPDVASAMNYLAIPYVNTGKYSQAEELYRDALAIQEKALGPEHPSVAATLDYMAALLVVRGRYPEAGQLFEKALAIFGKALGADHPELAAGYNGLGSRDYALKRWDEAEKNYRQALRILEKSGGPGSQEVGGVLRSLSWCAYRQGRFPEALELSVKSLDIAREVLRRQKANSETCTAAAASLMLKGRIEKAIGKEKESRASLKEAESLLGPYAAVEGLATRDNYAQVLLMSGKTEEAKAVVKGLNQSGYRNPDLLELCGEKGIDQ